MNVRERSPLLQASFLNEHQHVPFCHVHNHDANSFVDQSQRAVRSGLFQHDLFSQRSRIVDTFPDSECSRSLWSSWRPDTVSCSCSTSEVRGRLFIQCNFTVTVHFRLIMAELHLTEARWYDIGETVLTYSIIYCFVCIDNSVGPPNMSLLQCAND